MWKLERWQRGMQLRFDACMEHMEAEREGRTEEGRRLWTKRRKADRVQGGVTVIMWPLASKKSLTMCPMHLYGLI